ncbi:MAG TPA: 50S ribosomal protein L28 [Candidatus Kapabacteria bacterium]|jgi:large subunit ribosomal protein L28|nr:50S ribosomal protein L28 [Candidatus Kapabacteria bacterium]HOV92190.1 50S ribosomal protein L28 [Candidatus Kapabacteria bacterium]
MARRDQITGKTIMTGNNVSHANNRTRRRFLPNLQSKRIWVPEENRFVKVKVSAKTLRTIDKKGLTALLKDNQ